MAPTLPDGPPREIQCDRTSCPKLPTSSELCQSLITLQLIPPRVLPSNAYPRKLAAGLEGLRKARRAAIRQ